MTKTVIMWGIDSGWKAIPMCLETDKKSVLDHARWFRKIWKAPKEFKVVKVAVTWKEAK